jgi:hypothetical protein
VTNADRAPRQDSGTLPADATISGFGLYLREWTDADLPVMVELFDDPQVDRWTPLRRPFDLAAARAYLDQARTRRAEGRSIQLAITTDEHTALGEVLLFVTGPDGREPAGRDAELAYAVGPASPERGHDRAPPALTSPIRSGPRTAWSSARRSRYASPPYRRAGDGTRAAPG